MLIHLIIYNIYFLNKNYYYDLWFLQVK
ncbi:hypothetical protein NC651_029524 [Populus alba x Populus x berolinensis]|nr:hypothetical protein NC651_029524 [Populus alba x Populus x berolinensis]